MERIKKNLLTIVLVTICTLTIGQTSSLVKYDND
jgi:hypothetical protein